MSFGQSIKSVFRQYATFSGRARRSEYWWFTLFNFLVSLPGQILFLAVYLGSVIPALADATNADGTLRDDWAKDIDWGALVLSYVPGFLVALALFLPGLAVVVRRLHDTGRSGWWYLISFLPFVGVVLLVFMFMDGEPYDNQYGPDPKAGERVGGGYPPQGYAQPGYPAPAAPAQYAQPGYPASAAPAQYAPPVIPSVTPDDGAADPFTAPRP